MSLKKTNKSGFTLIETVIYIALFAIIIGGGMVATYQIIEGTDKVKIKTTIEQEANFILRKIDGVLTGASSSSIAISPDELTIGGTTFSEDGGNLEKNGTPLNISSVKISSLLFEEVSTNPDGIKVTFTISSLDDRVSQDFTMTKYAKF